MEGVSPDSSVKRIKTSEPTSVSDENTLLSFAESQSYVQPRRMRLNRRLHEYYKLPRGSEQVIVDQFFRRVKSGVQYLPDFKSDAFYFSLRKDCTSNVLKLCASVDIMRRLECVQLKRQQYFFINLLKRNTVIVDKLIRWKFFYIKEDGNPMKDKKLLFKFNVLFAHFVNRRRKLNDVILKINNNIAQIILRAENSKYYLKKAARIVKNEDE
ncbi:hypothetical protein VCUG_00692 [Vavraia culicis subsp. floridensis]|uniref:Uncharacterized protein n=1 Tax=Vavraia culicis (isolate floridensis) TaxID=948595 RepID=L2GXL7_VAVCU|nr:uncharacterized protein VCUG_00692 [Vavraia culicis subsp. floridensis]ELA47850.1 hypothetical protein VCUG_00692 [Vavraia culicis subsp. floridensis]